MAGIVLFALCLLDAFAFDVEYNEGYTLSKIVERCDLVVVGRVTEVKFVWRDNIETKHTTDVKELAYRFVPNNTGGKQ